MVNMNQQMKAAD